MKSRLTSFSKNPERSRHDDIPISSKAFSTQGDSGSLCASSGCAEDIKNQSVINDKRIKMLDINQLVKGLKFILLLVLIRLDYPLMHDRLPNLLRRDLQECSLV